MVLCIFTVCMATNLAVAALAEIGGLACAPFRLCPFGKAKTALIVLTRSAASTRNEERNNRCFLCIVTDLLRYPLMLNLLKYNTNREMINQSLTLIEANAAKELCRNR